MADGKPRFYTLRKHRKKSVVFAALGCWLLKYGVDRFREYLTRRQFCEEAKVYAEETTPALQKPRKYTVFFNATAGNGNAEKLFTRNAEPILHLAGLDVTIIKTDYEGQIKTLMQYIDPTIDGIIVAGGDGTLLEAVTGLLRRPDQEQLSHIPFGVIPIGSKNSFYQKMFGRNKVAQAREIGQATMAIVKGDTCHADVMEIKGQEGRSTFAVSSIHWGAFRDAAVSYDKYWWSGPFRKKMAYIAATIKGWPPTHQATLVYPTPEPPNQSRLSTNISSGNNGGLSHLTSHAMASVSDIHSSSLDSREDVVLNGWVNSSVETLELSIELAKNIQDSWFSIDGEPFDARPVHIKLHQDKLKLFAVKTV
ncbi:hypothetical protein QZH41_020228 [Actinostola sp. cb2023]|nr:hypothetical protein QZH41_020228 [Actinostola sp. cb2023]